MNAVGIDFSKGKSTVVVLRPFGEIVVSPFVVSGEDLVQDIRERHDSNKGIHKKPVRAR